MDSWLQLKKTIETCPPQKSIRWWLWMGWLIFQVLFQISQGQILIGILYFVIELGCLPMRWSQQPKHFYRRKRVYTSVYLTLVFIRFGWFLIQTTPFLLLQSYSPAILYFHLLLFSIELSWIPFLKHWRFKPQAIEGSQLAIDSPIG